jgi:hypothetical protein
MFVHSDKLANSLKGKEAKIRNINHERSDQTFIEALSKQDVIKAKRLFCVKEKYSSLVLHAQFGIVFNTFL